MRKRRRHEPHRPIQINHSRRGTLAAEPQERQVALPANRRELDALVARRRARVDSMIAVAVAMLMNGPNRIGKT